MDKISLALVGASGRMGKEILKLLETDDTFVVNARVSRQKSEYKSVNDIKNSIDVVIDFSLKENFRNVISWCRTNSVKLVSGVTGITKSDMDDLYDASKEIPCFWSPNMSLGINLIAKILPMFSKLDNTEVQLMEMHHKNKKDSPSGTALFLHDILKKHSTNTKDPISVRGGGVHGIHEIIFMGEDEIIELKHTALNRRVFAKGTLAAAKWLSGVKKPGLYSFQDMMEN